MYDVIIVGGGASGVMCAIQTSSRGLKTLILDKNQSPAKKLMVTGNGKCNLTNIHAMSKYYNTNIDKFLDRFGVTQTLEFFQKIGLVVHTDNEGRVYPYSNNARSVVDVLSQKLRQNKVEFKGETEVVEIRKEAEAWHILTQSGEFLSKSVVLSCGPSGFVNNFGAVEFYPSLCALKVSERIKKLSGIRLSDVTVTAQCGSKTMTDRGEVLFKDEGLSGIVVFKLSCLFARNKCYKGTISIDLMDEYSLAQVENMMFERVKRYGENALVGLFSDEVAKLILRKVGVDRVCVGVEKKLAHTIKNLEFEVVGYYDNNQVLSGGVSLNDLDDNLQSKTHKSLYVIGELCDVDGECGGYNLQWAWTSGYVAGSSL